VPRSRRGLAGRPGRAVARAPGRGHRPAAGPASEPDRHLDGEPPRGSYIFALRIRVLGQRPHHCRTTAPSALSYYYVGPSVWLASGSGTGSAAILAGQAAPPGTGAAWPPRVSPGSVPGRGPGCRAPQAGAHRPLASQRAFSSLACPGGWVWVRHRAHSCVYGATPTTPGRSGPANQRAALRRREDEAGSRGPGTGAGRLGPSPV
jgi:hypothetical protein